MAISSAINSICFFDNFIIKIDRHLHNCKPLLIVPFFHFDNFQLFSNEEKSKIEKQEKKKNKQLKIS